MPALNVMTTCDTLASSASRIVCIRSCESGRTGLCPMIAPWMDSATSASTKTGMALLPTLSSTTGPARESRTSIFWTRTSDELLAASSPAADKLANKNADPTRDPLSLPMAPSRERVLYYGSFRSGGKNEDNSQRNLGRLGSVARASRSRTECAYSRAAAVARDLQGACRDQHHGLRWELHGRGGGHGRAP